MPSSALTVAFVVGVTPGKWARVWAQRLPGHPLTLLALDPEAALAGLEDGTVDVALLRLPVDADRWHAIPLYEELAVVVAPKDHAIDALDSVLMADLAGENVLGGSWEEAMSLVATTVGVAIMPQSVARALSRRDVVARPLVDGPTTRIALVWRLDRREPLLDEFIGIVRGRTANSSRGTVEADESAAVESPRKTTPKAPKGPTSPQRSGPKRAARGTTDRRRGGGRGR